MDATPKVDFLSGRLPTGISGRLRASAKPSLAARDSFGLTVACAQHAPVAQLDRAAAF
jgi:hypothetical protein